MPAATFASIRSVHAGFAGWLLVAILLHAILLLIPSKQGLQPGQVLQRLTISLQATAREESVFPTTSPAEVAVEPNSNSPNPKKAGPLQTAAPARPLPALASNHSPGPAFSVRRAVARPGQPRELESTPRSRDLGVFRPPPLPDNWRPGIPRKPIDSTG